MKLPHPTLFAVLVFAAACGQQAADPGLDVTPTSGHHHGDEQISVPEGGESNPGPADTDVSTLPAVDPVAPSTSVTVGSSTVTVAPPADEPLGLGGFVPEADTDDDQEEAAPASTTSSVAASTAAETVASTTSETTVTTAPAAEETVPETVPLAEGVTPVIIEPDPDSPLGSDGSYSIDCGGIGVIDVDPADGTFFVNHAGFGGDLVDGDVPRDVMVQFCGVAPTVEEAEAANG